MAGDFNKEESNTAREPNSFTQKVLKVTGITIGAILLVLLLGSAFQVLLLILAGALMAIFFRGTAKKLCEHTSLSSGWSLAVVIGGVLALTTAAVWMMAPQVQEQIAILSNELPRAVERLTDTLQDSSWGKKFLQEASNLDTLLEQNKSLIKQSFGLLSSVIGVLATLYVILFLGIFFMAQPNVYRHGIVLLFPMSKRTRAREVVDTLGQTLYRWLIGKLFTMLVIGVFTTIGLFLLGIPMALVLGLVAGVLSFVPNFGPLFALVPAILIALLKGPEYVLYIILLYEGIQIVESNVITPLVQQEMIKLPLALILIAQLLLGVYSGPLGLILATPIIAVVMVLVKMLYIQDVLGDKDVKV